MPRRKVKAPNPELANLPMHIYKQPNGQYKNVRTGEVIPISQLHKHLPITPDPTVGEKRWDLNY